jgi:hypothetical protein
MFPLLALGPVALGQDSALYYLGRSLMPFDIDRSFADDLRDAGAPAVVTTETWPPLDLMLDQQLFVVWLPKALGPDQEADVAAFLATGGLLLVVVDIPSCCTGEIAAANALLGAVGVQSAFTYDELDLGCQQNAGIPTMNPLADGIGPILYGGSTDIQLAGAGQAVFTGASGQTLIAIEGRVVLVGDTNALLPRGCGADPDTSDWLSNVWETARCGPDADGDDIGEECDTCPGFDNRIDADGDGAADACDTCPGADDGDDPEGDGVPTGCDSCPVAFDPLQYDSDVDGVGNACDACATATPARASTTRRTTTRTPSPTAAIGVPGRQTQTTSRTRTSTARRTLAIAARTATTPSTPTPTACPTPATAAPPSR